MKKLTLRTDIFDLSGSHYQVFFLTKNGNQKGHECHKGLKIPNFSYLMRSKVTLPRFAEVNFNSLKSIGHVG